MDADLDTLATALYVRIDDVLKDDPSLAPWRPLVGITPRLSDAELVTLAVMQAHLGFTSETRWLRYVRDHLRSMFPYVPDQSGYNKRLRAAAGLLRALIRILASECSSWSDDMWLIDSTPVECGRSAPPRSVRPSRAGPATGTAPATPATSGACGSICCAPVGAADLLRPHEPQGR